MQLRHLRLVFGVVIAAVSLVVAGAAGGAHKRAQPGTTIFGAEQEPPCLNLFTSGCNNTWTTWTAGIALASPYIELPNFQIVPYMSGPAKVVRRSPFTLAFTFKKGAKWSDGKPVTVADFRFTWQTIVNPKWDIASRSGWDQIRSVTGKGRHVRVTFSSPYAPWKVLLDTSILPQHALAGADFNSVWDTNNNNPHNGQAMATGPFKLQSYTKGQKIVMVRNPTFFGRKLTLASMTSVFRTVTDT